MTWASGSVSRSVARTGVFLRKQMWLWPIIAVVVLATIGLGLRHVIESTMKERLRGELDTLLRVETAMIETWYRVQQSQAELLANARPIRESTARLLQDSAPEAATDAASVRNDSLELQRELAPSMTAYDYAGYFVADRTKRIVAATNPELLGQIGIPEYETFLTRTLDGQSTVSPPFPSVVVMRDAQGRLETDIPTMFVCAPIRNEDFQVVAALALRIRPEREFTRILSLGSSGRTGETYAFDRTGRLVSNSRFDNDLILLGLLPDRDDSQSILNISLRDPQGDLTSGHRPQVRRSELPLMKCVAEAIAGRPGSDVDGSRDYRGVPVVAAWTWLPDYDVGVLTSIDAAEAFRPLTILRTTFFSLFGLLIASSLAILAFTVHMSKVQRQAREAAVEARQLGQYTLEEKVGSGAMGVVYRGHHAMLRRPTAVKLLDVDKVTDETIQRFEREVQITCQLNHPNTVAIYDYGRTPEGVFYYAMEYLDGITLQTLVDQYGPQPEGRIVRILSQVCGSLYEAHSLGLVHRDIKPANIMINRRGGEADVVKILDFGLVKALDEEKQSALTGANSMAGTPLYMSPEAIQTPALIDPRSDLYAVGAVGYFLLTGRPVFDADSLVRLCQQHVSELPIPPSERTSQPVSGELESALLACLDKNRARRPQTARDLAQLIARSPAAGGWSLEDADDWWGRHDRGQGPGQGQGQGPRAVGRSSTVTAAAEKTILGDMN
ncbi:MAG: serine/threonine protein kinase [Planctomyces sp.]|nr:serine/threonine protein kinase [Planctomyces sp.]